MKILLIEGVEAQLLGDQAFLYFETSSEVLNIEGIEHSDNAEEIILKELELLGESKFSQATALFS